MLKIDQKHPFVSCFFLMAIHTVLMCVAGALMVLWDRPFIILGSWVVVAIACNSIVMRGTKAKGDGTADYDSTDSHDDGGGDIDFD